MASKREIRQAILNKRNQMSQEERLHKSRVICSKVEEMTDFADSSVIYCYASYGSEVETKCLIEKAWQAHKKVALPRVEGENMTFHYVTSFKDLEEGYKGIREPKNTLPIAKEPGLMIMPGVAFDRRRHRIGYGKGFYDRYLSSHQGIRTVAPAYELQVVEEIAADEHDVLPMMVITEERNYD